MTRLREHRGIALLLGIVAALLVAWSIVVPAWESNDEADHWLYVVHVHDTGVPPPYDTTYIEGDEPPLYYYLVAPFATNGLDITRYTVPGPHGKRLYPLAPRLYKPSSNDLSQFSALHVTRLVTALLSLLGVLFTYLAALELAKRRQVAILAAALVGMLPEFAFRGMSVAPDGLVVTTSALATWLMLRIVVRGFSWRRGLSLGVAAGLAFLTKINALAVAAGGAVAVVHGTRMRSWQPVVRQLAFVPAALMAAPWLISNTFATGDPLALGASHSVVAPLIVHNSVFSYYFLATLPSLIASSFVGDFGYNDVHMPSGLTAVYLVLMVGSAFLAARLARRNPDVRRTLLVLTITAVVAYAIAAAVNLSFSQPQGRYLFPALPALAIIGALGFGSLPLFEKRPNVALWCGVGVLAALQVIILAGVIAPAYALPG